MRPPGRSSSSRTRGSSASPWPRSPARWGSQSGPSAARRSRSPPGRAAAWVRPEGGMLHQRHYTADQANDILPVVRVLVRRLQAAKRTLTTEGFDPGFAALPEVSGGAYGGRTRAEAVVMAALGFQELEELDVVVRDLEAGLIDFPSVRAGREVYLCRH